MSFNQAQFFESLKTLTDDTINNHKTKDFIFEFLKLLNISKNTITALKNNDPRHNVAAHPELGEVANRHRLYFKPIPQSGNGLSDLDDTLNQLKQNPLIKTHKIRILLVTDFDNLLIHDTFYDETIDCAFSDLDKNYDFLLPLAGLERAQEFSEHPADVKATEKMGRLFDQIRKDNEFDNADDFHALNVFLTRLLFCFFADDTGIFKKNQFYNTLDSTTQINGSDIDDFLYDVFDVLNMPHDSSRRDGLPRHLSAFPYVNGGLFEYPFAIPKFNARTRRVLLECARLDWAQINPDIFGSMFQAVIDPEQRSNLGQHYTSVSNIMKVINPLFLQELQDELNALLALSDDNRYKNNKITRLDALLDRISAIKIFDPACGSGNFLIIAYKQLRELEIQILQAKQTLMKGDDSANLNINFGYQSHIKLGNFYGIDLDNFPCQIAQLSLWLAEHQMNQKFHSIFGVSPATLPLKDSGHLSITTACSPTGKPSAPIMAPMRFISLAIRLLVVQAIAAMSRPMP